MGVGLRRNAWLAIRLYCDAATTGSAEGFFRIGRILARGPLHLRNPGAGQCLSGAGGAAGAPWRDRFFSTRPCPFAPLEDDCSKLEPGTAIGAFDVDAYLSGLSPARRRIAELIRRHAARYGVEVRIALAIALAESNLNPDAVSPKNAQGVMQLIPDTQARFGVTRPFDPESQHQGRAGLPEMAQGALCGRLGR
jgi:hypothetical protein